MYCVDTSYGGKRKKKALGRPPSKKRLLMTSADSSHKKDEEEDTTKPPVFPAGKTGVKQSKQSVKSWPFCGSNIKLFCCLGLTILFL